MRYKKYCVLMVIIVIGLFLGACSPSASSAQSHSVTKTEVNPAQSSKIQVEDSYRDNTIIVGETPAQAIADMYHDSAQERITIVGGNIVAVLAVIFMVLQLSVVLRHAFQQRG